MQYHYHLQSFIYSLLKGSKYHDIHDKEGYKFFCFSNIFPVTKTIEDNSLRTFIVSSPDREFVDYLFELLYSQSNVEVHIGSMKFKIDFLDKFVVKLPHDYSQISLITGTPIIIRIPKDKYKAYGIKPSKDYDYVYWRSGYPIDLFISAIENNLLKKYSVYYYHHHHGDNRHGLLHLAEKNNQNLLAPSQLPSSLIQKFKFKKQISTRVFMKGFEQVVIGTLWELNFYESVKKDIVQFSLDSGLGERNSLGFGFMNMVN
jgi:CRISPR-associated endoribonuclease Cas6